MTNSEGNNAIEYGDRASGYHSSYGRGNANIKNSFSVLAQSTPNMTLKVLGGSLVLENQSVVDVADQNSPTFTAPGSNKRIDLLYMQKDGTLEILQGTSASSPTAPAIPPYVFPICFVYIPSTATKIQKYKTTDASFDSAEGYIYQDLRNNFKFDLEKRRTTDDFIQYSIDGTGKLVNSIYSWSYNDSSGGVSSIVGGYLGQLKMSVNAIATANIPLWLPDVEKFTGDFEVEFGLIVNNSGNTSHLFLGVATAHTDYSAGSGTITAGNGAIGFNIYSNGGGTALVAYALTYNGTKTETDTGVGVGDEEYTIFKIVRKSGKAYFYINGFLAEIITTNLPTGADNFDVVVKFVADTALAQDIYLDYVSFRNV
jgi:hypothetical protein